ncbi:MAG: antitoxin VapB family protein [Candidatus Methanoperedens sp.]|nr:antitoxin VapB family protein [Candidatus Methanoperedens sp.]
MTAKTITIREDIYKMLLSIKGANESFSDLFERLIKSRKNIDKLKELRGSVEFRNKETLLKELSNKRKEIIYPTLPLSSDNKI